LFVQYTDAGQQTQQRYYFEASKVYDIYFKQNTVVNTGSLKCQIAKMDTGSSTLTILDFIVVKNSFDVWYDKITKETLRKLDKKTFTVDKSGKDCDFISVGSAINFLKSTFDVIANPYVLFIKNGLYDKEWRTGEPEPYPYAVIEKGSNKISLIGESVNGTILQYTNTSTSRLKVLDIGGECSIENLTVNCLNDGTYVNGSAGGHQACYAIHNDSSYAGEGSAHNTVVKNVVLFSRCSSPIGAGLHKNQKQIYKNVKATSSSITGQSLGAVYVHNSGTALDTGGMSVDIVDCEAVALDGTQAIILPDTGIGDSFTIIPCLFQKNLLYTTGSTETSVTNATHLILPYSKLNSNAVLNK
jgi:hypothetical protein